MEGPSAPEVSTTRIDSVRVPAGGRWEYVHLVLSLGREHPGRTAQSGDDDEADQDAPPAVFQWLDSRARRYREGTGGKRGRATNPLAILSSSSTRGFGDASQGRGNRVKRTESLRGGDDAPLGRSLAGRMSSFAVGILSRLT